MVRTSRSVLLTGKGTQCAKLVDDYKFVHLSGQYNAPALESRSLPELAIGWADCFPHIVMMTPPAGDLLRAEQKREGSDYGAMIKQYITEGKIVPMEVTIKLLENAMRDAMANDPSANKFLIDGFPRQMDQAIKFDASVSSPANRCCHVLDGWADKLGVLQVCPSSLVLFLVCPEATLQERLLERGKTSGRDDDNAESIKKRFSKSLDFCSSFGGADLGGRVSSASCSANCR